jgi:hypothetical protein
MTTVVNAHLHQYFSFSDERYSSAVKCRRENDSLAIEEENVDENEILM